MAARQFGFVVARALAIYCWLLAIGSTVSTYGIYLMMQPGWDRSGTMKISFFMGVAMLIVEFFFGTFLWTMAEKFAGPVAEETAKVQRGDWIVRLVFSGVGVFILAGAFGELARSVMILGFNPRASAPFDNQVPYVVSESIRFLIGLWLVLTNRFTRYHIAETAGA